MTAARPAAALCAAIPAASVLAAQPVTTIVAAGMAPFGPLVASARLIAFQKCLTDRDFLSDPAFANPWREGHPATGRDATLPEDPS